MSACSFGKQIRMQRCDVLKVELPNAAWGALKSSPVDHHIRLRMQAACHLLDTTVLSVKEMVSKLGYDDPYYFSRIFQKILDCSPLAFRRLVKE